MTDTDLDQRDPLAPYRDRFVGAETPLVYFDGNSLGRPLRSTGPRLAQFVTEEWGGRLIRGWDERWFHLPETIGDDLGRTVLGAAPGQTVVGDSTTVLLYKAMRAAVAVRPGRTEIVVDRDNFPTDRYVADGVARECGLTLRWIDVDTAAGVEAEQLAAVVGPHTALVLLSHVAYRSAHLADMATLTAIAHDAGALVLWDLSHSVGSVPVRLDECGVDLAVGCTYKYLNGGPGAPAFVYVAERLLDQVSQPVQGWMGASDPFLMGPDYRPAPGVRRMLSGTPPVVGMLAMQDMLALVEEVGIEAVRAKSVALAEHAIALADERLPGVTVASPRESSRRGGHVTLNHPLMKDVTTALWAEDVIPDYRDPHGLRLGLSPLSTSFAEVEAGLERVRLTLERLGG
ncbi:kynureninase [Nocardioides sp. cx-173]|uniref:kynureninase n=1 Tax=Nocardioides sp. cx-173 TaxID=2898796 RepID=UPI001E43E326|nr:aminotransferase class V-fold PLP-dependent enzyme [Nocardioides sp. cx-173]MCD4524417.1 aminotransferase class V-fold PLP-dependent enzyme [Nocardioides sp. cx-173]UGB43096.1 aminotransferase class V-fold PLP-dependent enzyme [Nocardioides sp. cx-173]